MARTSLREHSDVYNWLRVGVKTVFLQDAGNMTLSTTKLIEVMFYLKQVFPGLGRITCYARAKSLVKKRRRKTRRNTQDWSVEASCMLGNQETVMC